MEAERIEVVAKALPAGVVTFLFTDVEGSSKLWERCPEPARAALIDHDAILRTAIERHRGAVFKTVGDAFCAAFERPVDALAAAIAAQRALSAHLWPSEVGEIRVRMGIHSGESAPRDGDYFGPSVNRVARLTSIAFGEQILVSAAAASLMKDALDGETALRDLGVVRLKDLSRPEPAYQAIAPGLRSAFPPLPVLDSRANNLPLQVSSFVGRERELDDLAGLLAGARLLTIAGAGGIGKTRTALQLAASAAERYKDGAWLVDLTALREADLIPQAVATALDVRELPNEQLEATIFSYLADRRTLLIVDNTEHLLSGAARFIKALLAKSPGVTVLATGREPLHVPGEQVYRLGPLAEPAQLFMERARQASPSTNFGAEENADVAALCAKLEGIPLAIELACARLSSMTLKQLARRLQSSLTLTTRDSTESSRHRALRETIAWSYELLLPEERAVLMALSVFHGGCSAQAIAAVAGEVTDVDEIVDSLVDKSLLQVEDSGGERYRLLDVVREYAAERLRETGAQETERRQAAYYSQFVLSIGALGGAAAYAQLDRDVPNIRAALEWNFAHGGGAVTLIEALSPYWRARGNLTEARSWIRRALEARQEPGIERGALLCRAASFATLQDELAESLRLSNEALALYRDAGDDARAAQALFRIAEARHRQGQLDDAEALYRETLGKFRSCGDRNSELMCLGNLGMLARQRGDSDGAVEMLGDAIERASQLGERRILGELTMAMAWAQLDLNDVAHSRRLFERAFADKTDDMDRYGLCSAQHGLATVALVEGRFQQAREEFLATLDIAMELQLKDYIARAFHGIAAIEARGGDAVLAARLLGLADRLFDESGRELRDSLAYDIAFRALEGRMPELQRSSLREEGRKMGLGEALAAVTSGSVA